MLTVVAQLLYTTCNILQNVIYSVANAINKEKLLKVHLSPLTFYEDFHFCVSSVFEVFELRAQSLYTSVSVLAVSLDVMSDFSLSFVSGVS